MAHDSWMHKQKGDFEVVKLTDVHEAGPLKLQLLEMTTQNSWSKDRGLQ